jgi:hypothetical protein
VGKVLILLVIILLAIVYCAFIGIFGRYPDEWEWIGIIVAGVALAMATPSIFQIFWGRAHLETEFHRHAENNDRALVIFLKNPPVKKRLLKLLRVKRESVQSITAEFSISEVGSNTIIVPIRHARIYSDDDPTDIGSNRIVLPPTFSVAASIAIAQWDNRENKAIIPGDRLRQSLLLGGGRYRADLIIFVDGDPQMLSRQFVVGEKGDDLIWIKPK